jgi:hypothetical protein
MEDAVNDGAITERRIKNILESLTYKAAAGSTIALEAIAVIEGLAKLRADLVAAQRQIAAWDAQMDILSAEADNLRADLAAAKAEPPRPAAIEWTIVLRDDPTRRPYRRLGEDEALARREFAQFDCEVAPGAGMLCCRAIGEWREIEPARAAEGEAK